HFAEGGTCGWIFETHRHGAYVQLQSDDRLLAFAAQSECRAQGRMPGEGQLLGRGEYADAYSAFRLPSGFSWEDESGLGQIHLSGNGLHLLVCQSSGIGENG